eukprot:1814880-Rhodomonas_salina.5
MSVLYIAGILYVSTGLRVGQYSDERPCASTRHRIGQYSDLRPYASTRHRVGRRGMVPARAASAVAPYATSVPRIA